MATLSSSFPGQTRRRQRPLILVKKAQLSCRARADPPSPSSSELLLDQRHGQEGRPAAPARPLLGRPLGRKSSLGVTSPSDPCSPRNEMAWAWFFLCEISSEVCHLYVSLPVEAASTEDNGDTPGHILDRLKDRERQMGIWGARQGEPCLQAHSSLPHLLLVPPKAGRERSRDI